LLKAVPPFTTNTYQPELESLISSIS